METLGLELRRWRMDRELSQAKMAGLLGVSKSTIENWELGETEPRSDRVPAIDAVLRRAHGDTSRSGSEPEPNRRGPSDSSVKKVWTGEGLRA